MLERGEESTFTPRELVGELDRYIVGQDRAKRAVAIALRNRWRRQQVADEMRDEITPKNIIMIGPTGVGKTEIARRLSKLVRAPFIKVEASKFTEVGYVGRDVDSIVRDLTDVAINLIKDEKRLQAEPAAAKAAEERLLDLLVPPSPRPAPAFEEGSAPGAALSDTREKMRRMLRAGELDERQVTIEVPQRSAMPLIDIFSGASGGEVDASLRDMLGQMMPRKTRSRQFGLSEALRILTQEEAEKRVDMDAVVGEAISRVENNGIVFLDEIDKIAGRDGQSTGPDVSRQGVQRDILPIIEGCTVSTKHGLVRTDHILFIAAGAFHAVSPNDLIPELQGRFPIRVELDSLGKGDFVRILTEPRNALTSQYVAMMATEGVTLEWEDGAIQRIAELAEQANLRMENIGARRLHTILELLLDDISFDAPERRGQTVRVDAQRVDERLGEVLADEDLTRYIL